MATIPSAAGPLPLSAYMIKTPEQKKDLRKKLLESVVVISSEGFDFKGHWAETLQGEDRINPTDARAQVLINDAKFRQARAGPGYREKMPLAESRNGTANHDSIRSLVAICSPVIRIFRPCAVGSVTDCHGASH